MNVIDTVCEEEGLKCNRNMPVIKLVPINSLEGDFVGLLTLFCNLLGMEP